MLSTLFGSGLSTVVTGTKGTLAAQQYIMLLAHMTFPADFFVVLLTCVIGIKIFQVTSDDMNEHDHCSLEIEEVAVIRITMS
ncbi:phosphatidylglycerophosphatase A, partial [Vibrio parahaemolyticus]|uniref:phosphatidylglycerophosphatase A n=1 Tax=Vibrio parahaemolyticus TaxID=670 RepID=UPI0021123831